MATVVQRERESSTSGVDGRGELEFYVIGADTLEEAKDALLDTAPETYDGLDLHSVQCDRVAGHTPFGTIWEATVYYGRNFGVFPQEEPVFTFETGGGTQHITHSKQTVWRGGVNGDSAPDQKGAIGVNGDNIDGVDIVVPQYRWSETHYKDEGAEVNAAYRRTLFDLTGKTNSEAWRGYKAGEVLFLGATGRRVQTPDGKWELTYHFAASPNAENLVIGDIAIPEKAGWDYLWVMFGSYVDTSDPDRPELVKRPRYAYVERVYDSGKMQRLKIG